MSSIKYFLIVFVTSAIIAYVTARPQKFKEFAVSAVANKTMCPIKVEINDDPDRIPRRIKYLMCADKPNKMCNEHHMSHGCCRHHHHAYRTECVEIYDYVLVSYKEPSEQKTLRVPVGCTCLVEKITEAEPMEVS